MKVEDVDKLAKELLARAGGCMEIWILRKLLIADLKKDGGPNPEPLVDKFLLEAVIDKDLDDYCTEPFGTSTRLCLTRPTEEPPTDFRTRFRQAMKTELRKANGCLEQGELAQRVHANHFPELDLELVRELMYAIATAALSGGDPDFSAHHQGAALVVCLKSQTPAPVVRPRPTATFVSSAAPLMQPTTTTQRFMELAAAFEADFRKAMKEEIPNLGGAPQYADLASEVHRKHFPKLDLEWITEYVLSIARSAKGTFDPDFIGEGAGESLIVRRR